MPMPDPDPYWPSCDDEPPGVSIRPLRHADLAALLAHLQPDHNQDLDDPAGPTTPAPVVAVRVRATVGRPGASAHAAYRRRRAAEWAAWTSGLPWRAAAVLAAGVGVGMLAAQLAAPLAGLAGLLAAASLGWVLRFRVSPETSAWRRGAAGERRTARLLSHLKDRGWMVLHDLAVPGSAANIDHLVIGPGGVVVIDSKQYRGRLQLDPSGLLWHGRHLLTMTLRAARWEADQADEVLGVAEIRVAAIVAVHGAGVPWGRLEADGVTVVPARRVPDLLRAMPPILGPNGWPGSPTELDCASTPPPRDRTPPPEGVAPDVPGQHQGGEPSVNPYALKTRTSASAPKRIFPAQHPSGGVVRPRRAVRFARWRAPCAIHPQASRLVPKTLSSDSSSAAALGTFSDSTSTRSPTSTIVGLLCMVTNPGHPQGSPNTAGSMQAAQRRPR